MKHHNVSLLVRDHDTGREYPVYDHIGSDQLGALAEADRQTHATDLGDPEFATGILEALNPIVRSELTGLDLSAARGVERTCPECENDGEPCNACGAGVEEE